MPTVRLHYIGTIGTIGTMVHRGAFCRVTVITAYATVALPCHRRSCSLFTLLDTMRSKKK